MLKGLVDLADLAGPVCHRVGKPNRRIAMYIQRTPAVFPLSFRLPPLLVMLARIVTFIRPDVSDRRQTELAPHLRYDVGEIDYDPDRISSLDKPNSYESQFWLHHDPR